MASEFVAGLTGPFYGVDFNHFKLGRVVWEAVEDENDGYRSMLGVIQRVDKGDRIFFRRPLAWVEVCAIDDGYTQGYQLVGRDGHVWLTVGTENYDDYYPCFVFRYTPPDRVVQPTEAAAVATARKEAAYAIYAATVYGGSE